MSVVCSQRRWAKLSQCLIPTVLWRFIATCGTWVICLTVLVLVPQKHWQKYLNYLYFACLDGQERRKGEAQQLFSQCRHDTEGAVVSLCALPQYPDSQKGEVPSSHGSPKKLNCGQTKWRKKQWWCLEWPILPPVCLEAGFLSRWPDELKEIQGTLANT